MIPELVGTDQLSRANGTINMLTNAAVIFGTLVAGLVSDRYSPQANEDGVLWLPAVALLVIAVLGFAASWFLTDLRAGDRSVKYQFNPFESYIFTIREMAKTPLLTIMMAWSYFYLLAGIALFIVPEYTTVLDVTRAEASVLMGVLGIAIGVGCGVAGFVSGRHIEPRLIPIGAIGLTLFFFLLAFIPPTLAGGDGSARIAFSNVSWFILGAGFFAGFYIVPLQALLQSLSPDSDRGRYLGTANAVSFAFMTVAAIFYWLVRDSFGDQPQLIFYICSGLMAIGAGFFIWRLAGIREYLASNEDTELPETPVGS